MSATAFAAGAAITGAITEKGVTVWDTPSRFNLTLTEDATYVYAAYSITGPATFGAVELGLGIDITKVLPYDIVANAVVSTPNASVANTFKDKNSFLPANWTANGTMRINIMGTNDYSLTFGKASSPVVNISIPAGTTQALFTSVFKKQALYTSINSSGISFYPGVGKGTTAVKATRILTISNVSVSNVAAATYTAPLDMYYILSSVATPNLLPTNVTTPSSPVVKGTPLPSSIPTPIASVDQQAPYIKGYIDNTFRPENSITRAEIAAILSRLSDGYNENQNYASSFGDIKATAWYQNSVGFGSQKGIIKGYSDGTFKPDGSMTRAEFATVIARFKNLSVANGSESKLSDISGHWALAYITALNDKGWISGYKDGTFRPDATITRAEAVKIINAAIGRIPNKVKIDANITKYKNTLTDVLKSNWAYYDILEATVLHISADFN